MTQCVPPSSTGQAASPHRVFHENSVFLFLAFATSEQINSTAPTQQRFATRPFSGSVGMLEPPQRKRNQYLPLKLQPVKYRVPPEGQMPYGCCCISRGTNPVVVPWQSFSDSRECPPLRQLAVRGADPAGAPPIKPPTPSPPPPRRQQAEGREGEVGGCGDDRQRAASVKM